MAPRFRNLFDYSTEENVHRPQQTLIDVPITDSVKVITLHFEDSGFVQIIRKEDNDLDWEVVTSFDSVTKRKGNSSYVR